MNMNISEDKIKLLIRESLMNEVTQLITKQGGTSFIEAKYKECKQIKIPPIFKDLFIDKVFGETPNEIRNNIRKNYSDLERNEQTALLFAEAFSDDNINIILDYMTQFANIMGVPAMFCEFLQLAVDKAAGIIELFYDREAQEASTGDVTALFNLMIIDYINQAATEYFEVVAPNVTDQAEYLATVFVGLDQFLRSRAKSETFCFMLR